MKKFFLVLFILLDIALIAGSAYVLQGYLRKKMAVGTGVVPIPTATTPALSPATTKSQDSPFTVPPPPAESSTRKILFSYRNPRVRQVSIRADFTGWKAEPMVKDAKGTWTYFAQLTPGEYAYCFTADDKTFKDPFNKKTKQIGRTLVSAIQVEPLPTKPIK